MKVLTVYAQHNPHSPCHALLEQFDAGLRFGLIEADPMAT
jgi:hypothetical protein